MAILPLKFDANTIEPSVFDPVPAGWYTAAAFKSDVKPTSAGTGTRVEVTWQILDGQYKGRQITDGFNIVNQNPKAELIGQQQLSSFCHAVRVLTPADTSELHNLAHLIRLKISPASSGYDARNSVCGWKPLEQKTPASVRQPAQAPLPVPVPQPPVPQPPVTGPPVPQPGNVQQLAANTLPQPPVDTPYDQQVSQVQPEPNPAQEVRDQSPF